MPRAAGKLCDGPLEPDPPTRPFTIDLVSRHHLRPLHGLAPGLRGDTPLMPTLASAGILHDPLLDSHAEGTTRRGAEWIRMREGRAYTARLRRPLPAGSTVSQDGASGQLTMTRRPAKFSNLTSWLSA